MGAVSSFPTVVSSDYQRLTIPGRSTKPGDGQVLTWDATKGQPQWADAGGGGGGDVMGNSELSAGGFDPNGFSGLVFHSWSFSEGDSFWDGVSPALPVDFEPVGPPKNYSQYFAPARGYYSGKVYCSVTLNSASVIPEYARLQINEAAGSVNYVESDQVFRGGPDYPSVKWNIALPTFYLRQWYMYPRLGVTVWFPDRTGVVVDYASCDYYLTKVA